MKILKETKKAKLLEKGEVKFWIQKRWQRADGSLTPAGERSYEEAKEAGGEIKYVRTTMLTGKVIKETVKAVLFNAAGTVKGRTWWPKSQIEVVADSDFDYLTTPEWLELKKMDEGELYL